MMEFLLSLSPHLQVFASLINPPILIASLIVLVAIYLVAISKARFRAIDDLQAIYGTTPAEFKKLNYKDAQTIACNLYFLEAPWMFMIGQYFAVVTIFGLTPLAKMSHKKFAQEAALRVANTFTLASEWLINPLDSERSTTTLNRINYIHSHYKGIENDAMLFTLCCLICQIVERIDQFEYRQTLPLERHASYVFWKEIGIRLGIKESSIPDSFEGCAKFIKDHADKEMRPNEFSAQIGQAVIHAYQATLPKFLRPLFANIFLYQIDERIREVYMFEPVDTESLIIGTITTRVLPLVLKIRAKFIRYCLFPRTRPPAAFEPAPDGMHTNSALWQILPYYVQGTWWNRWGPVALCKRAFGLPLPGDSQFMSQGYKLEALGFGGKGGEKVLEAMDRAKQGGCPFTTFGRIEDEREIGGVYAKFSVSSGNKSS